MSLEEQKIQHARFHWNFGKGGRRLIGMPPMSLAIAMLLGQSWRNVTQQDGVWPPWVVDLFVVLRACHFKGHRVEGCQSAWVEDLGAFLMSSALPADEVAFRHEQLKPLKSAIDSAIESVGTNPKAINMT